MIPQQLVIKASSSWSRHIWSLPCWQLNLIMIGSSYYHLSDGNFIKNPICYQDVNLNSQRIYLRCRDAKNESNSQFVVVAEFVVIFDLTYDDPKRKFHRMTTTALLQYKDGIILSCQSVANSIVKGKTAGRTSFL